MKIIKTTGPIAAYSLVAMAIPGVPAVADEAGPIEEIIVSAQRRDQSLQDVPSAVSVFSGSAIEQTSVRELAEIADYLPNFRIARLDDFTSAVSIRGVGAFSRNIGFDTRVGVYVDGVYLGQSPAINQVLLDLDRVEVLRGPQGTLFGKNTVAGALNIVTKRPSLEEFSGDVTVELGNLDSRRFIGVVNIPVSDNTAIRAAVSDIARDGYVTNEATGREFAEQDGLAFRFQVLSQLSDKLELVWSVDGLESDRYGVIDENLTDTFGSFAGGQPYTYQPFIVADAFGPGFPAVDTPSNDPIFDGLGLPPNIPLWDGGGPSYENDFEVNINHEVPQTKDVYGTNLTLTYDLDNNAQIKSITGYRQTESYISADLDYSTEDLMRSDYGDEYRQFSQEFHFISPSEDRFSYLAGLFLYYQEAETQRNVLFGPPGVGLFGLSPVNPDGTFSAPTQGEVDTTSVAVFFNATYDISEKMELALGGRYSYEEKEVDWSSTLAEPNPFGVANERVVDDRDDNSFDPMVSLSYFVNDDITTYARFATAYKSGGWNLDFVSRGDFDDGGIGFDTETNTSFEVGMKSFLLNRRLMLNVAGFYSTYDDYQVNQFKSIGGSGAVISIENAAEVITQGVEVEFSYSATDALTFEGNFGYLDAYFDEFPGGATDGSDASGNSLPGAADFTFAASMIYEKPLSSTLLGFLRLDYLYTDEFYTLTDSTETF